MIEIPTNMKDLSYYIFKSDIAKAFELIQSGADVNGKYGIGIRPIISAINSDNPEMLRFLISEGADINIDNGLPLHETIDFCIDGMIQDNRRKPYPEHLEMLRILLENGADLELKNKKNERPIDIIAQYAHSEKNFNRLKSYFRDLIPKIDELIKKNF